MHILCPKNHHNPPIRPHVEEVRNNTSPGTGSPWTAPCRTLCWCCPPAARWTGPPRSRHSCWSCKNKPWETIRNDTITERDNRTAPLSFTVLLSLVHRCEATDGCIWMYWTPSLIYKWSIWFGTWENSNGTDGAQMCPHVHFGDLAQIVFPKKL